VSHQLDVGSTIIPYDVRESAQARAMKIVATPSGVEVVAPTGTPPDAVAAYVARKRRWVFDAVRALAARHEALLDQQYGSGAKLQYRGRWLMLDVQAGGVEEVEIACRSKLHVTVPAHLVGVPRLEAVRAAFDRWLRARARDDLDRFGRKHAQALGVTPGGFRVSEARGRWGSCGRDGVIRAHWQLAQAPAAAFEYVVAHEVAHLVHRNHSENFWRTLARTLPSWPERKAMLERWAGERRAV
jgi:predicted metal-dependent hydrolase